MALQPHQQRVVDERIDLFDKCQKLEQFIYTSPVFAGLPSDEQFRLKTQYSVMMAYLLILTERITHFEGPANVN